MDQKVPDRTPPDRALPDTAALIDTLATNLRPSMPASPWRGLLPAMAGGGAVTLVAVLAVYGVQPGLAGQGLNAPGLGPMAMKDAYVLALALLAATALLALGRPGAPPPSLALLLVPFAALGVVAGLRLAQAGQGEMPALLLGQSWWRCPLRIAVLALPLLAAALLALRRQAPVRLVRAGAVAGVLAGAVAAAIYALACTETSPAFVVLWYSLGIALAALVGALLAPRALRW